MTTSFSINTVHNPFRSSSETHHHDHHHHHHHGDEPPSPTLLCAGVGESVHHEPSSPLTPPGRERGEATFPGVAPLLRPQQEEVDERGAFLYSLLSCSEPDAPAPLHPLSYWEKLITLIWVHKSRLLGKYSFFQHYIEQCPCRPSSPSARSFALSYSATLANLRRRATDNTTQIGARFRRSSSVVVEPMPNTSLRRRNSYRRSMSDPAPVIGSEGGSARIHSNYLTEIFRMQPFAAAAYLRTLLLCWAAGIVLQAHGALSFNCPLTTLWEHCAWQWLLAQLVIQCIQLPIRVDLYFKLGEVSRAADAAEAADKIRNLVTAPVWLLSQCLGTLFHTIASFGPFLLYILPVESPVRRQVMSLCCANLLIFILRTVLTFVILHSILESRNSANKNKRRALSMTAIRRLSRAEYTADKAMTTLCSICLCHYDDGDGLVVLPCDDRHCFHEDCITQWLVKTNSCPLCQRTIPDPASDW